MNVDRVNHGCATFEFQSKRILVVAGGYSTSIHVNRHVEFLDLDTKAEWIEGIS